jgi:hypothetical protein
MPNRVRVAAPLLKEQDYKRPLKQDQSEFHPPPRRIVGIRCFSVFMRMIRTGKDKQPSSKNAGASTIRHPMTLFVYYVHIELPNRVVVFKMRIRNRS